MNVKLKRMGHFYPLSIVEDSSDLLLLLIREDLKAHKLAHSFNEIGCESPHLPDLTDAVLDIFGFSESCRTNEFYDKYEAMMNKHIALLNGNDDVLGKVAGELMKELKVLG